MYNCMQMVFVADIIADPLFQCDMLDNGIIESAKKQKGIILSNF